MDKEIIILLKEIKTFNMVNTHLLKEILLELKLIRMEKSQA